MTSNTFRPHPHSEGLGERGLEAVGLDQLQNEDRSQHSAVSDVVKQKLKQVILGKQGKKVLEKRKSAPTLPIPAGHQEMTHDPSLPLQNHPMRPHVPSDSSGHPCLRRTDSEPITKMTSRRGMLSRKTSLRWKATPPADKHLPSDAQDSPLSRVSTPASECSSHTGSLPDIAPNHTGLPYEYDIAQSSRGTGRVAQLFPQHLCLSVDQAVLAAPLSTYIQPVLIPMVHSQILADAGWGAAPTQYALVSSGRHQLAARVRSEPLPWRYLHANTHANLTHTHAKVLLRAVDAEDEEMSVRWRQGESWRERKKVPGQMRSYHSCEDWQYTSQSEEDENALPDTLDSRMPDMPAHTMHGRCLIRLGRTNSSPLLVPDIPVPSPKKTPWATGLVYDALMLKHECICGNNSFHPEHAGRIQSIWSRLIESGVRDQCECIKGRRATDEELRSVHSDTHVLLFGSSSTSKQTLDQHTLAGIFSQRGLNRLPCGGIGLDDTLVWNKLFTGSASSMAAGCVTELALLVAQRQLQNGFAIVRPPGHYARRSRPEGFSYFNSVAIAAKQLQQKTSVRKILIVNWDVHHGAGTQTAFYRDPSVLYISLHRYDNGNFFPGTGGSEEVGEGPGEGFNVNVAWTGAPMGDPEYLAAFRCVVMPIAAEFAPDVVLVSCGFDAAAGHHAGLGGYTVSPKCFGVLTQMLMGLAGGRVVLALEGGYELSAICDAAEACTNALLGNEIHLPPAVLNQAPCADGRRSLERVIEIQGQCWHSVRRAWDGMWQSHVQAEGQSPVGQSPDASALASLSMSTAYSSRSPNEPQEHDEGDSI